MAVGWMDDIADADDYFFLERIASSGWDDLADDAAKTRCLNNAYNRIYYSSKFDVPLVGDATAAQLVILKKAQCEMAEYLAIHLADEDRRKGLISQGVVSAGIVKESYDKDRLNDLPVPPFVEAMLEAAGFTTEKAFGFVGIDRDEDETVDYDATDL